MEKAYGRTLIALTVILALVLSSFVYAAWRETITVEGTVNTGELDWGFTNNISWKDHGLDWTTENFEEFTQLDKNVGSVDIEVQDNDNDGDYEILKITIDNAYPGYAEHISFGALNTGTVPLIFEKVIIDDQEFTDAPFIIELDLSGDGLADIKLYFGNHLGSQLDPDDPPLDISIGILVLQECPEGATLEFTIQMVAVQYNMYGSP